MTLGLLCCSGEETIGPSQTSTPRVRLLWETLSSIAHLIFVRVIQVAGLGKFTRKSSIDTSSWRFHGKPFHWASLDFTSSFIEKYYALDEARVGVLLNHSNNSIYTLMVRYSPARTRFPCDSQTSRRRGFLTGRNSFLSQLQGVL